MKNVVGRLIVTLFVLFSISSFIFAVSGMRSPLREIVKEFPGGALVDATDGTGGSVYTAVDGKKNMVVIFHLSSDSLCTQVIKLTSDDQVAKEIMKEFDHKYNRVSSNCWEFGSADTSIVITYSYADYVHNFIISHPKSK